MTKLLEAFRLARELMAMGDEIARFVVNLGKLIHEGADPETLIALIRNRETKAGKAGNWAANHAGPRRAP